MKVYCCVLVYCMVRVVSSVMNMLLMLLVVVFRFIMVLDILVGKRLVVEVSRLVD